MRIAELFPHSDWFFSDDANDERVRQFDLRPYLQYEVFEKLNDLAEFMKIKTVGISLSGKVARIFQQLRLRHKYSLWTNIRTTKSE